MELILKLIEKYELHIDSYTGSFLLDKDELLKICNDYKSMVETNPKGEYCICSIPELPIGFTSMDKKGVKCVKCGLQTCH